MNIKPGNPVSHTCTRICAFLLLGMLAFVTSGCRSTSPILLQLPSAKGGAAEFAYKIGINPIEKAEGSKISSIGYTAMFIYWYDAKMPRRKETDYVHQSVSDHVTDSKIFKNAYIHPFDPSKVDFVMDIHFDEFKYSNAGAYATIMALPFINFLTLVGVPQDIFSTDIEAVCTLKTRGGKVIGEYKHSSHGKDAVNIYEMPYGNYLWYDSIFRTEFDNMMQSFYEQIRKDKQIMATEAAKLN
jgi:hypothetical protein